MTAPKPLPRRLPKDGYLVTVSRIINDELTKPTLGGDGHIVKAPRWDLWLPTSDRSPGYAWTKADKFIRPGHGGTASIADCPAPLTVVARPTPADLCYEGECPADPHQRDRFE